MSTSRNSSTFIITQNFSTYSAYIIFTVGLIGNMLNILLFIKLKTFRGNRCAFYLATESVFDIFQLCQILVNEILRTAMNVPDASEVSIVWCKLRNILHQWFRLILSSIVCFVALDQFFCTNYRVSLRKLSSFRAARYQTFSAILLFGLHTIPFAIFLQIKSSLGCVVENLTLTNYYVFFYYPFLNGFIPIFISSLFSILAYRNVRRIVRRQIPIDRRKRDQQLTAMIFARVVLYVILSLPYTVYRIYWLDVTANLTEIDSLSGYLLIATAVTSLTYLNHAMSFYVFLATSTRFRRQVKNFLVKKCWQSLKQCGQNTVHPPLEETSHESATDI